MPKIGELPNEHDEIDDLDEEVIGQNADLENDDDEDDEDDDLLESGKQLSQQQIVDLATRAALAQQPRQQQQQMLTQDEIDAKLQRFKVTEEHIQKVFDPETPPALRMKLLQEMLDGAAKHAVTSSQVLMQSALSPLQQQQEQYNAYVRNEKITKLTKHVETKFPALAGKKQVIKDSIQALVESGYNPPGGSKSALQKEIAKIAAQRIRQVDPSFSLKSSNNPQRQAASFGSRRQSGQAGGERVSNAARSFIDHL